MNKDSFVLASLCLLQFFIVQGSGNAFELNTHIAISQRSIDASGLNNFLISVLGFDFPAGVDQPLKIGQFGSVRGLIAQVGAVNEDKPFTRTRFHFHDPLQPWSNAGLRWPLIGQMASRRFSGVRIQTKCLAGNTPGRTLEIRTSML